MTIKYKQVCERQEEYIKLLERDNAKMAIFITKNGGTNKYDFKQEDIDEGLYLRRQVEILKNHKI